MNEIQEFSTLSTNWVESLALEEINMEESGVIHMDDHLNPAAFIEESSIKFMDQIRELVEFYVAQFNKYRGGQAGAQIKIFKISNTVNDFMLFRNSLRLVISRKASDLVTVGFLSGGKEVYSPRSPSGQLESGSAPGHGHEIRAHIGAFNEISWRYSGDPVDVNSMVRFYISEFIRHSSR